MSQATSMRKRHRFNSRMTRIVLLISFIFFFGRFIYSSVGALAAPSEQKRSSAIHTLRRITGTTLAVTFSTFTEHNGTSLSDAFAVWDYQSGRYSFILNFTSLS